MKRNTSSELHLFIIWSKGRIKEKEIIADIDKNLRILEVLEITWDKSCFFKSLCRFYSLDFLPNSIDVNNRGNAPFLLITALDNNPRYEIASTSSGHSKVNINLLNLKKKYRDLLGNDFGIHSTVTHEETRHNLAFLLGKRVEEYLKVKSENTKANTRITKLHLNPVGTHGWSSMEEVFSILNESINYVMLRDFNASPEELGEESDIDLLVDDLSFAKIAYILNAKTFPDNVEGTIMCQTNVNGASILFHIHSYSYLPAKWVLDILSKRSLHTNKLYIPSFEDRFYSLVYQLLYLKQHVKDKYYSELTKLYQTLFPEASDQDNHFDNYAKKLNQFISSKEYFPQNSSLARQNFSAITAIVKRYIEALDITNVEPFRVDLWKPAFGYKMFTGITNNGTKAFIKYFGEPGFVVKEYKVLSFLKQKYPTLFPQPLFFSCLPARHQILVMEFINGQPLTKELWGNCDKESRYAIINNIIDIVQAFYDSNVIHRDIFPSNILITNNNQVFIVDYEYVIDNSKKIFSKHQYENDSLQALYTLGEPYNLGLLKWNDAHSAIQIIQELEPNFRDNYPNHYQKLEKIKLASKSTYVLNINTFKYIKKRIKLKLALFIKSCLPYFKIITNRVNS